VEDRGVPDMERQQDDSKSTRRKAQHREESGKTGGQWQRHFLKATGKYQPELICMNSVWHCSEIETGFIAVNLSLLLIYFCVTDYLFSLGKLTSEHVSKTAIQLKSVLEDKVGFVY